MKKILFLIISLNYFSCSENNVAPSSNDKTLSYPYETTHFAFYYTDLDSNNIQTIGDTLESNYSRIINDLMTDTLPEVNVHLYSNHDSLAAAVNLWVPNLPSWASGLAISQSEIYMMSPNHPQYGFEPMLINLVHEFAHCVSYHIRPNIANNPRWLWESIAIYEARQFFDPHNLPYMVSHNPPTLSQLNSFSNTMIYEVGYLIAEYVDLNWDRTHLVNLIRTNGNLQQVLGMSTSEFETGWFQFVANRYGL